MEILFAFLKWVAKVFVALLAAANLKLYVEESFRQKRIVNLFAAVMLLAFC